MGRDINFQNIIAEEGYSIHIGTNPSVATGNKLLANIFEITFMTTANQSLLSDGFAGDGDNNTNQIDRNDIQSISSIVKLSIDKTVANMKLDQDQYGDVIPKTERIDSAKIKNIDKIQDQVYVNINVVPEEYEEITDRTLLVSIPL